MLKNSRKCSNCRLLLTLIFCSIDRSAASRVDHFIRTALFPLHDSPFRLHIFQPGRLFLFLQHCQFHPFLLLCPPLHPLHVPVAETALDDGRVYPCLSQAIKTAEGQESQSQIHSLLPLLCGSDGPVEYFSLSVGVQAKNNHCAWSSHSQNSGAG